MYKHSLKRCKPLQLLLAVFALVLFSKNLAAHPFHVTVSEIEYNQKSKRFEIGLKIFTTDLERELRKIAKGPIDLEKTKGIDQLLQRYLAAEFHLFHCKKTKQVFPLIWVGKEVSAKEAWLYFEIQTEGQLDMLCIENNVLLNSQTHQINTMNFRIGKVKKTVNCTKKQNCIQISSILNPR